MKTVIIGGGKGCKAIVLLAIGRFLKELPLTIECIIDPDPNAPGMVLAREIGIPTRSDYKEIEFISDIDLVIELTGSETVLTKVQKIIPAGTRFIDHTFARIFWDLMNAQRTQKHQLIEMMKLEKKVEKEWHFLQGLFDTIPDLVVVLNPGKRIIKINASFSRFSKISKTEALGKRIKRLIANTELEESIPKTDNLLDQVFITGHPQTLIWFSETPKESYWDITFTPILNHELSIEAVLGAWHRTTEKMMLYHKVESAEHKFKSFIDSANDWISIRDLNGQYLIVNPVLAQAYNLEPRDFIGKTPEEIFPPKIAEAVNLHDQEVIHEKRHKVYNEDFWINNRKHQLQTVRFPLTDYKDTVTGVCTIARDVTAENDLKDQLIQTTKLAAVGKLAAGVAHEINNPLTGVLVFAEDILEELPQNDPMRNDIGIIIRETLRCREIVRNLLDFAKQEKPQLKRYSPNKVVEQSITLIHKLPQFRNILIQKDLAPSLPFIKCDLLQLQQVILNLMINASDAMEGRGKITIGTQYHPKQDQCVIWVEDNGPGIPLDVLDKIFEPFFSSKGSNGLGLAVSWGIIERHQGILDVHSSASGSLFSIRLPAESLKQSTGT